MRGNELLDKMELVDPSYVYAAEQEMRPKASAWQKWGAVAACLGILLAGVLAVNGLPDTGNTPTPGSDETDDPMILGTVYFNESEGVLDAARKYIPGYFTQALTAEQLAALQPKRWTPAMSLAGYAGFDGDGSLLDIYLDVSMPFEEESATVHFSYLETGRCYQFSGEPLVSTINGHTLTIWQMENGNGEVLLEAYDEEESCSMCVSYTASDQSLESVRDDFLLLLNCFTSYEDGKPDFSNIVPAYIPEFKDQLLTLVQGLSDPDFGAYLPIEPPAGFAEEAVRRYMDQNHDYLSGLWTKGYHELRWKVSHFDAEAEKRLTHIGDTEKYDLSLYPIPRAESVPSQLQEIVDNPVFYAEELTEAAVMARTYQLAESGEAPAWHTVFSVKFDDIVIEVRTKGVDPLWIYQQLQQFMKK